MKLPPLFQNKKGLLLCLVAAVLLVAALPGPGRAWLPMSMRFPASRFYSGQQLKLARAIEDGDAKAVARLAPQTDLVTLGREKMTFLDLARLHAMNNYQQGRLDVITALVRAGADDYGSDDSSLGRALLVIPEYPLILKAMLDGGLPPDAPYWPSMSQKPIIFRLTSDDSLEALRLLVQAGAEVNPRDSLGYTPIFDCANAQNWQCFLFLLASGADPTIRAPNGVTASNRLAKEIHKFEEKVARDTKLRDVLLAGVYPHWPEDMTLKDVEELRAVFKAADSAWLFDRNLDNLRDLCREVVEWASAEDGLQQMRRSCEVFTVPYLDSSDRPVKPLKDLCGYFMSQPQDKRLIAVRELRDIILAHGYPWPPDTPVRRLDELRDAVTARGFPWSVQSPVDELKDSCRLAAEWSPDVGQRSWLSAMRDAVIAAGYPWPPPTDREERRAMRARGERVIGFDEEIEEDAALQNAVPR